MNILAIMAHADDAAFFCAGTLLNYKAQGHNIFIAVTTGTQAPVGADELGAQVRLLGFEAGSIRDDMITRPATLTAMRWANADILLTHAPWDGDSDHAITAKLVMDSLLIVGGKLHPADLPPIDKLPHLFYTDTHAGTTLENRYAQRFDRTTDQTFYLTPGVHSNNPFEPEAYVDVTAYMQVKEQLLSADPALAEGCHAQCRMRGIQMGTQFAEAFTGHRMVGHIADYRLLP